MTNLTMRLRTLLGDHACTAALKNTTKRAGAGKQIVQMLLDGELDVVLGEKVDHPGLKPLFPDASAEEKARKGPMSGMPPAESSSLR